MGTPVTLSVVDASAVVRAFVNEDGTSEAQQLLQAIGDGRLSLVAPAIIVVEVAHAFIRSYRQNRLSRAHAIGSYLDFLDLPIERHPTRPLALHDFEASIDDGSGAYDRIYVALARELSIPLITADDRILSRLPMYVRGYTPADALIALRSGTL